jgi:hypothetical protein
MARRKTKLPKIQNKNARSQYEFTIYKQLTGLVNRSDNLTYETDTFEYTITSNYTTDFTIERKDGTTIYIEAKGLGRAFDHKARQKMIAVKQQHPDRDIRIVFMRDGPLQKNSKMRASDWAVKYKFPFAVGTVPKEWFE